MRLSVKLKFGTNVYIAILDQTVDTFIAVFALEASNLPKWMGKKELPYFVLVCTYNRKKTSNKL